MDRQWAETKLREYEIAVENFVKHQTYELEDYYSPYYDSVLSRESTAKRIMREVDPEYQDFSFTDSPESARKSALRALGVLADLDEVEEFMGDPSPTLAVDSMHLVVWDAAARLWGDGHYGPAVQRSATFLCAHVKHLLGRHDVGDVDLMRQAFSDKDPEPSKPRLRWPGDPSDLTVKAMNDGIRLFAPGALMAIRNPATHSVEETPKHEAVEQLAALSLLARWIDECKIVREV